MFTYLTTAQLEVLLAMLQENADRLQRLITRADRDPHFGTSDELAIEQARQLRITATMLNSALSEKHHRTGSTVARETHIPIIPF